MRSFNPKFKKYELKIHWGIICHYNEEWRKIWRWMDLSFQSWQEEFDKFWREHLKVSKSFVLNYSFWAKYILIELKKYRGVIFHETEERYKLWRGIVSFQNWHKDFDKFWPEHSKVSKVFTLIIPFWEKHMLFELKNYRGIIFHDTEEPCKSWRKADLWFGKRLEKFGKFSPEHFLKIGTLMGSFCPK